MGASGIYCYQIILAENEMGEMRILANVQRNLCQL